MGTEAEPVRLRRAWRYARDIALDLWRRSVPVGVGLFGLGFGCLASNDQHEAAVKLGLCIGAGLIMWALDLAYERGRAVSSTEWGHKVLQTLVDGAESTITVTHEHRASPEALAIIRAEAAHRAARDGGVGEGNDGD